MNLWTDVTNLWRSLVEFADAGGPFRWAWVSMWLFVGTLMLAALIVRVAVFVGEAFMSGYRAGYGAEGPHQGEDAEPRR